MNSLNCTIEIKETYLEDDLSHNKVNDAN